MSDYQKIKLVVVHIEDHTIPERYVVRPFNKKLVWLNRVQGGGYEGGGKEVTSPWSGC